MKTILPVGHCQSSVISQLIWNNRRGWVNDAPLAINSSGVLYLPLLSSKRGWALGKEGPWSSFSNPWHGNIFQLTHTQHVTPHHMLLSLINPSCLVRWWGYKEVMFHSSPCWLRDWRRTPWPWLWGGRPRRNSPLISRKQWRISATTVLKKTNWVSIIEQTNSYSNFPA